MGFIVKAECICGFHAEDLSVGYNWLNIDEIAICYKCQLITTINVELCESINLLKTYKRDEIKLCPKCKYEYTTYNEEFLYVNSFKNSSSNNKLFFACPKCNKKTLHFEICEIWLA